LASEVDKFKNGFFDRGRVLEAMDAATFREMKRMGALTRTVAKRSMVKRKGASLPGRPPHEHVGTIDRLLFFAYDYQSESMVVGPVGFSGSTVLRDLEYGKKASGKLGGAIAPRPFMRPAMSVALAKFGERIRMRASS
jgi:hypothetical protein